jgi:hypothetical protein
MLAKNELTRTAMEGRPATDGSDEAGRTLVEQLLILGIGGLLLAGSVVLGTQVYASLTGNSGTQQVGALISNVKALYSGSAGYGTGSLNDTLISAGEVPADMPTDLANHAIVNAWGGAVTVTGVTQTFTIDFAGVPTSACTKLALMNLGSGVSATSINAKSVTPPLKPIDAATACANTGSGSTGGNTVTWTVN